MSSDLGLDPSDPLNILLHNTPQSGDSSIEDFSSSSQGESPPDWSQLSMWAASGPMEPEGMNSKYPGLDFNLTDMDFDSSMAVDPSALQYNDQAFTMPQSYPSNELLSASFPFTFSSPDPSVSSNDFSEEIKPRRLSVASSSSSSGASLSPVMGSSVTSEVVNVDTSADELAQRVRQSAGVMLAVPAGMHAPQPVIMPEQSVVQAKLPIPRLPRPKLPVKAKKEVVSSVPSSTAGSPQPSSTSVIRPKTSHTTIERRYRTNLNARIQSLRAAVPALRVLEDVSNNYGDVVDERGFVDGVKVARKVSKANVLGKAVEYIRVLKKREARLKREQDGLKSLLGGLVGGPALLKEWEREWIIKFGGEEKDEVEDDEAESDDDDGEEDDDEDGEGRARKKAKVVKPPKKKPAPAMPVQGVGAGAAPEKRKRGRPRKNPMPTVSVPVPVAEAENATFQTTPSFLMSTQGQSAQQYLLATFALFSFFNSPLTSSSSHTSSSHTGSVLTPVTTHSEAITYGYGWHDIIQAFHLLVTALVFFSIVVPWLPAAFKRSRLASSISSIFPYAHSSHTPSVPVKTETEKAARPMKKDLPTDDSCRRASLMDALALSCRGTVHEAAQLRDALGVSTGMVGLVQGVLRGGKRSTETFEQRQLEQRAWVRLGELVAMDRSVSTATRLQTYWCMRAHISWFKASTSDLSTLALIIYPLSSTKAEALWLRASKTDLVRPYERLVLQNMRIEQAVASVTDHSPSNAPLGVLAALLVRERVRRHASVLFVRTVLPDYRLVDPTEDGGLFVQDADENNKEEVARGETIEAGKSLGGRTRELAELLEKVWNTGFCALEDVGSDAKDELDSVDAEIRSLLRALVLYRRIFPSAIMSCADTMSMPSVSFILSPPPSPSRKNAALHLALRRALDSSAFDPAREADEDLGGALEDAKDRVVDMLFDFERATRGRGGRGGF